MEWVVLILIQPECNFSGSSAPKRRRTEEQIGFALRQAEAGTTVAEICRKLGVSEATAPRSRSKPIVCGRNRQRLNRILVGNDYRAYPNRSRRVAGW